MVRACFLFVWILCVDVVSSKVRAVCLCVNNLHVLPLSAAGESIRMLYVGSGGGLWLHGFVPWREFSFLLVWHLRSKLRIFSISMSFSLGVTIDMASDILRSGSSDGRPRDCSFVFIFTTSHARTHETYICISSPSIASTVQLIGGDENKEH